MAEDVRYYGKWMRDEAEKRIGHLYPKVKVTAEMAKERPDLKPYVGNDLTVIAWLWARTVASPNPAVGGTHVPLVRSFWLSTKKGNETWVEPVVNQADNTYCFLVRSRATNPSGGPPEGVMSRRGGRCLISDAPMAYPHIRAEAKAGRMGARLMAIVAEGTRGRVYLSPEIEHEQSVSTIKPAWRPEGEMPKKHRNFQPPVYGMNSFGDLFTNRQLVALGTFSDLVKEARRKITVDANAGGSLPFDHHALVESGVGPLAYADAVATYLAFAVDKSANYWSNLCSWHSGRDTVTSTFGRQALPMVWDFAEANPFSDSSGNFSLGIDQSFRSLSAAPAQASGQAKQLDATTAINGVTHPMISTDPPYYDNIAYADLSDFFYVWLRRSLSEVYPTLFSTLQTPKVQELIAAPYRFDGSKEKACAFFERGLGRAFEQMRDVQEKSFPLTVFYAFKQVETEGAEEGDSEESSELVASTGWETMLEGLIHAGFAIGGTWPMRTELIGNLKKNVAALASSVVLVCRPRSDQAALATRREFLNALKRELPDALKHLQRGNIAPVDLAQASIGPGMAVFTRYAKVMEADGSPMKVRQALSLINQTLDEVLAEQEGEFDADTRWALTWFEQFGMDDGPYGVAETLSKAKVTAVNALEEAGIVLAKSGKVRLIKRDELDDDWDPASDNRLRHWEIVQHLIRALETKGETAAADLLRRIGGMGEAARDLAYRLYNICERKGWASEALAYNGLVIAWPEISKLAQQAPAAVRETQGEIFR